MPDTSVGEELLYIPTPGEQRGHNSNTCNIITHAPLIRQYFVFNISAL